MGKINLKNMSFDFESLQKKTNINNTSGFQEDTRFWKLSKSDSKGTAIIRLLIDKNGMSYIKKYSYSFSKKSPYSDKELWYIEDSPSTIGLQDPVADRWIEYISSNDPNLQEIAKTLFKRRVSFITNILVVKDPASPENNGKVFLWEFGTKLESKFKSIMQPSNEDLELGIKPINLYDPFNGANILLSTKKEGRWWNYDDTTVIQDTIGPIASTDDEIEDIVLNRTYPIDEFLAPEHYKSYNELKEKMEYVLTGKKTNTQKANVSDTSEYVKKTVQKNTANPTNPVNEQEKYVEKLAKEATKETEANDKNTEPSDDDLDAYLAELDNI